MKKLICILTALMILLCGCSQEKGETNADTFTVLENGNILSPEGVEYSFLANEGILSFSEYDIEFLGYVQGEAKTSQHLSSTFQTGIFGIKDIYYDVPYDDILIRRLPDSEWRAIYRKASLPDFDYSVDNCVRLGFASYRDPTLGEPSITDPEEIAAFLSTVRAQADPREAGLYELVKKPDGFLENCYLYGAVYGYFEKTPFLYVEMQITSYNDLAYSIEIEGKEYVLPQHLLEMFE